MNKTSPNGLELESHTEQQCARMSESHSHMTDRTHQHVQGDISVGTKIQ